MKTASSAYRIFVGATIVACAGVLWGLRGWAVGLDPTLETPSNLLLWMAMITIAATSPVPLPRSSATTTLTPVLDVAGLVLFGPSVAIWFGVLGRLIGMVAERGNPLLAQVSEMARGVLAIVAGGFVYAQLGGRFGNGLISGPGIALPLAAGALAYVAMRTALGLADAALRPAPSVGRGGTRPLVTYLSEAAVVDLVLLPFAILLALTHVRIGIVGAALFLVPLLLGRYLFKHWVETKRAQTRLVRTLMAALDAVDPFTRGHSYRIAMMSARVGRHLGLSRRELEELELAALLHDVGRAAIRHEIRLKPGRLTRQEQTQLQAHPQLGHDLLAEMSSLRGAAEIVLAHHEQPDGKGYPRGLAAAQIPVGSRIIMAVAAFDAMTSDRPYRQGLPPQAAFDELLAHSGTQFFPEVVEALIQLHADGRLFEEFEPEQLEEYVDGRGNSRALEEYARARRTSAGVPPKLGVDAAAAGDGDEANDAQSDGDEAPARPARIPILELPMTGEDVAAPQAAQILDLPGANGRALRIAALTDVGCARKNNEDAFGLFRRAGDQASCLVVLADGMGGAASGEVASRLAVETVAREYESAARRAAPGEALAGALEAANRAIHARAKSNAALRGMGTTCTAAGFRDGVWHLAHVGDSRAYRVVAGAIEQLTRDHTLHAELEGRQVANSGEAVAAHHVLTRNLGAQPTVEVDSDEQPVTLDVDGALVLCSDGLSNVVEDVEIADIVSAEDPDEACRTLVELARARGGPDNITVVIAKVRAA